MAQDPTSAYIKYLNSENCYVEAKCEQLMAMVHTLESNVFCLNSFIQSTYDISLNSANCVHIVSYNSNGMALSCANYDTSGNFTLCDTDMSGNFLPCVLPSILSSNMTDQNNFIPREMARPPKKPITKPRGYPYYSSYPYYDPYYRSYYDPYYRSYYDPYYRSFNSDCSSNVPYSA